MDPDETARMRKLIWIHAGRNRLKVLINFIGSVANATKNFTATYLGGPKIMSWMEGKSLADVGIICSCVLEVEWNVDEPVKEQNSYEELMQSITEDTDDIRFDMEDDPSPSSIDTSSRSSLKDILLQWKLSTLASGEQHLKVTRMPRALYEHALRCYERKHFDVKKELKVEFINEPGVDEGGLKREFFEVLLKQILLSHCFEETEEGFDITQNMMAFVEEKYHTVGKMIASILLQGGSIRPIFSHWFIHYASVGTEVATVLETVKNLEKKKLIEKLQRENVELMSTDNKLMDTLEEAGIYMQLTEKNKPLIVKAVTAFYSEITKKQPMLNQFWEGAEKLGLKSLLINYPEVESILCKQCGVMEEFTADKFMVMVIFDQHGEPGSNGRQKSEEITQNLESFVYDIEERKCICNNQVLNLGDLLKFLTGTSTLPPGGFDTKLMIHFTEENCYPYVSTCTFDVTLPLKLTNYKMFKEVLIESMISGPGFGRV